MDMQMLVPPYHAKLKKAPIYAVADMKGNRFSKHPFITFLLIALSVVLITEALLRIIDPNILKFAYNFRQVYRYHDKWYTDFKPNSSTRIELKDSTGSYFFNFIVTINEFGFRTHDRRLDYHLVPENQQKIIHTIGDSFTMGWGVNYEASYPEILDFNLPEEYRVLNLGLNGFGIIAATEKSLEVAKQFMPDIVIFLATENDYSDDEKAMMYYQRSQVIHKAHAILNFFRQNFYIASVPFALYWWAYYKKSIVVNETDFPSKKRIYSLIPENFKIRNDFIESNPSIGRHSKSALIKYSEFLKEHNIHLIVLSHGSGTVSKDIYAFCQENDIDSYCISVPENFRLLKEGHFNYVGNYKLAQFIIDILVEKELINLKKVNKKK